MKCKEKDCGGEVEVSSDKAVSLRSGCPGCSVAIGKAYPCDKCGSLYYEDGSSVATRGGANAFLVDGKLVGRTVKPNAPASERISTEPIAQSQ